jgi:hypothetical protein
LRSDAIIFILDEPRAGREFAIRRAERHRRREHEPDRRAVTDRDVLEVAGARGKCDRPDVARSHRSASYRCGIALEGLRDRVEHEPLAQTDTQVAREDLRHVRNLARIAARAEGTFANAFTPLADGLSRCGCELVEHVREGCRRQRFRKEIERRGFSRNACQRFTEIARLAICERNERPIDAPRVLRSREQRASTDRELSIVARGERVAAREPRGGA